MKREKRKGKEKDKDKAKEKESQTKDEEEDKQDEKAKEDKVCSQSNMRLNSAHIYRSRSSRSRKRSPRATSLRACITSTSKSNWQPVNDMTGITCSNAQTYCRSFYQMRIDKLRNAEVAKRNRERLSNPANFPSVPTGDP